MTALTAQEALERLLRAYRAYYDVEQDAPAQPFAAEAVFHSHEEQFFLVRSARISEAESHEYVFFAVEEHLTAARLEALAEAAWREGTRRVRPHKDHRNSDILLYVLTDEAENTALTAARRQKHYQSYRWGFHGWSHFLLFVVEAPSERFAWNRQGARLRKLVEGNLNSPDADSSK